jgi:hypothetical protein
VTSIQALKFVNVPTFFVFRTSCSVLSSALDYFAFGVETNSLALGSLFFIIFGAFIYASNDLQFSLQGYTWSFAHIFSMALYVALVKRSSSSKQPLSPTLTSLYNNLSLLSFLMVSVIYKRESVLIPDGIISSASLAAATASKSSPTSTMLFYFKKLHFLSQSDLLCVYNSPYTVLLPLLLSCIAGDDDTKA